MARNTMKMILNDFDGDEELQVIMTAAMEEEGLNRERCSRRHSGSIEGHAIIYRDRVQCHERLYQDYFSKTTIYLAHLFRRRFRMNRSLFLHILSTVEAYDPYFVQKTDVVGIIGLSSLQKMAATMRMLVYGVAADSVDDYVRIGESTAIESLKHFVKAMVAMFLREVVASQDLWIWPAFFGMPGSHNDINILDHSSVFSLLTQGRVPPVNYSINGNDYTMGYYIADGIYPQWATFVKTISSPQGNKQIYFAKAQESARKDVDRAFGVLQARFAIVRGPAHFWKTEIMEDIMMACIIMHNMIVEDERDVNGIDFNYDTISESLPLVSLELPPELFEFIQNHHY
ncbi:uncharacterized protein LOC114288658 [Camellia sinensis]|uniref:uncharacterized protein LOC114288658 n=1 Tax=Camellia sinensis TaxID=4442 RepID=UPI0010364D1B|nr:uncharacterized protein LOC114288658 [Camellia sinensis]